MDWNYSVERDMTPLQCVQTHDNRREHRFNYVRTSDRKEGMSGRRKVDHAGRPYRAQICTMLVFSQDLGENTINVNVDLAT